MAEFLYLAAEPFSGVIGQELHDLFIVTGPVIQSNALAALLS